MILLTTRTGFGVGVGVVEVAEVMICGFAKKSFGLRKLGCVAVNFEGHVAGVEADCGVGVVAKIQQLRTCCGGCLGSIGLRGCKSTKGNII